MRGNDRCVLLARAAGLSAHLYEGSLRSIGCVMSCKADQVSAYDGKPAQGTKTAE